MIRQSYLTFFRRWGRNLVSFTSVGAVLSSFGALWLVVEVTAFFFENTPLLDKIRSLWPFFGLLGLAIAIAKCMPRLSVSCKVQQRDATVEVVIGDLFDCEGELIVGTNTTFDTHISNALISEASVQGTFTRRYYGDETQLAKDIASELAGVPYATLPQPRTGKAKKYKLGTVVKLTPKDRTAYFVAIADINEHGAASGSFDGVKDALASLWVFLGSHGNKGSVAMPVLGTGYGRLKEPREEIVRAIVTSFVAACSESVIVDRLTIVLSPADVKKFHISLDDLGRYIEHVCTYTQFAPGNRPAVGTAA
jgi:hypothetical protein